jgi:hypothetical protein
MDGIKKWLDPKKPLTPRQSERGDLLKYFYINVNGERDGVKYPKLPIGMLAGRLKGLEVRDLYFLRSLCEQERARGGSWSKTFWGSLKPREEL